MTSWFGPAGRTGRLVVVRLAVLLLVAPLATCDQAAEAPDSAMSAPPPVVTVIGVQPTQVTPGFSVNGRVVAVEKVRLRARVTGFLDRRLFAEGSDVEQGDLLFVMEQTPFEAEGARANAQIARAQASLAQAQVTLKRMQEAIKNGSVSERELDQATAAEQRGQADLLAAKAKLALAELNLSYTKIDAPIAGRIGRSDFSVGDLVGSDSVVLETIMRQDPIYVTFPVSQRQLLAHRGKHGGPVVRVTLPDGTLYDHPGKLNFLDILADLGTDMVTVRAELPNPARLLVDGQFVRIRVERGAPELVLAVPQAAIQDDQPAHPCWSSATARWRRDGSGQAAMEGVNVLVHDGLNAGERVIVEGLQRVRPGMVVAVSGSAAMPAGPTGTCAKPGIGCSDEPLAMQERGAR